MFSAIRVLRKQWLNLIVIILMLALIGVIVKMYVLGSSTFPVIDRAYNFSLINDVNKPVKLSDSNGKVRLLTFIYTRCPTSCPLITHDMALIQNDLKKEGLFGKDVDFISITIDPQYDKGPVLQNYAASFKADPTGWQFLTGDPADISNVLKNYGIYSENTTESLITHSAVEYLIDKNGNIRKKYGTDMDTAQVEKDIQSVMYQ